MAKPTLNARVAAELCKRFVPLGENIFEIMKTLSQRGFASFEPYVEFMNQYCLSQEDRELHEQCIVEKARETIGQPWPLAFSTDPEVRKYLFESGFIRNLYSELEARNGVPFKKLAERFPGEIWRGEIDPCVRAMLYASIHDRKRYEELESLCRINAHERFLSEVQCHATEVAKENELNKSGRFAPFRRAMEQYAEPLGFRYDKEMSTRDYYVFSKRMWSPWSLCWALEYPKWMYFGSSEGRCVMSLQLRGEGLKGDIERAHFTQFLVIRYTTLISGFNMAYRNFNNVDELETIVKANITLYEIISSVIEDGVINVLSSERL